jgi:very-short-patch-repair endonuclease
MKLESHKSASGKLFELARENRRNPTEAEYALWQILRKKQLNGYRFRRQHPIDKYIVDFYCHQLSLIIEVDGEYHNDEEQKEYDNYRTETLEEWGMTLIRLSNDFVLEDIEKVREVLLGEIASFHHLPGPPERRGGATAQENQNE